jgi:hypothetical protein
MVPGNGVLDGRLPVSFLLGDLVDPLARGVLGRLDLLPTLAAQDADEAPNVCGCQPVAFMISASVTPLARFISAITSAFLFARSAVGLQAGILARTAFFTGLRLPFGCDTSAAAAFFSDSIVVFISFLLTGLGREHSSLEYGETASPTLRRLEREGECQWGD